MSEEIRKYAYTEPELLERLPFSPKTLYNMRQANEIPFIKIRGRVLYPVEQIDRWWNDQIGKGAA